MLNMQPELGFKKMFKEVPVLLCENETTTAMNYLIFALICYNRMPDNQTFVKHENIFVETPSYFHTHQKCVQYVPNGIIRRISRIEITTIGKQRTPYQRQEGQLKNRESH